MVRLLWEDYKTRSSFQVSKSPEPPVLTRGREVSELAVDKRAERDVDGNSCYRPSELVHCDTNL